MTYQVFDNGQSADYNGACSNMTRGLGWDNSKFSTLDEAISYALDYLGQYGKDLRDVNRTALGIMFMNGYAYSGAGDMLVIKKVS
jgi:hypothetical protein